MTSLPPGGPRALLVDFGGVLTSPVIDALASLSREAGLPEDVALRTLSRHEATRHALVEHEVGRLDDEAFEDVLAAALRQQGGQVEARGLLARLASRMSVDEAMVDLVREMRRRLPVALVSNSLGRDCYAGVDLDELFDLTVISAEVGVRKPSRRIYEIACERLVVAPHECVLVDDLQQNLDGAARLGVVGVLHREAGETAARLRALLPSGDAVGPSAAEPTGTTTEQPQTDRRPERAAAQEG